MPTLSKTADLEFKGLYQDTKLYQLRAPEFSNRYYVLSSPGTRHLMAFPEVVGLDSYLSSLPATVAAIRYLFPRRKGVNVDILTILRGGLNYPVEEACHTCNIPVRDIHFLSCERIIKNKVITGLEIKYEKVRPSRDRILIMGDIIATGDTLRKCIEDFAEFFLRNDGSLRRIIFFTVGGTRAIDLMEGMTEKFRGLFPGFEGFDCFFYEGIFTVYEGKGVSGINVRDIDFGWKGGAVAPEFRNFIMDNPDALYERCIIYDGGARRYELPVHFREVLEYWDGILEWAGKIDPVALTEEKLGYASGVSYEDWLTATHLNGDLRELYAREQKLLAKASSLNLEKLAKRQIRAMEKLLESYE